MNQVQQAAFKSLLASFGTPADRATLALRAAMGNDATAHETYLQSKASAALLECSIKTLFRLEKAGKLHAIRRTARCIRWKKSEIMALMAGEVTNG